MEHFRCSIFVWTVLVSDRMAPSNGFIPYVLEQQRREQDWQDKTLPVGKVVKRRAERILYVQEGLADYVVVSNCNR